MINLKSDSPLSTLHSPLSTLHSPLSIIRRNFSIVLIIIFSLAFFACGDGKFVAVTSSGEMAYSIDGIMSDFYTPSATQGRQQYIRAQDRAPKVKEKQVVNASTPSTGSGAAAAPKEGWFGTLGNGKFEWKDIVYAMALPFAIFTSCTHDGDTTPVGNQNPIADGGGNQNVSLSSSLTVTLNGSASSDPDGSIASYAWECTGYAKHASVVTAYTPPEVTGMINNANTSIATVDLRKAGTYTFKLTVTDNKGATATQNVQVTVNPMSVTKNVGVTFPAFTPGSVTLDLTPTYNPSGGSWGDFNSSEITYTISDSKGNIDLTSPIYATSGSYNSSDDIVFTQTFTQGENNISSSFVGGVMNMSGLKFVYLLNTDMNVDLGTTIPPVSLNLSKDIADLLP